MNQETLKWTFLGTAGGRFVVFRGLRSSAGYLIAFKGKRLHIDPGPCALNALLRKKLNPSQIHGVYLSHRDLDHSAGLNVIVEGMTDGGFKGKKRGFVFLPSDALKEEPVLYAYLRNSITELKILEPKNEYRFFDIIWQTSPPHSHRDVICFGFKIKDFSLGFIPDTGFDKEVLSFYKGMENIIVHMVLLEHKDEVDHLSYAEMPEVIGLLKPKRVFLTHFGMRVIMAKPKVLAQKLSEKYGIEVIPCYDGMDFEFEEKNVKRK